MAFFYSIPGMKLYSSFTLVKVLPFLLCVFLNMWLVAEGSGLVENSAEADELKPPAVSIIKNDECDPQVDVIVDQEPRFDVLKVLGEKYRFSVSILKEENEKISLEKHDKLSRVVESITRDISVVMNYKKENACNRLVSVSVLNESASYSFEGYNGLEDDSYTDEARTNVDNRLEFVPVKNLLLEESHEEYQARIRAQEAVNEAREEKRNNEKLIYLNNTIQNGQSLRNIFNARSGWNSPENESLNIDNMERYVEDVLEGNQRPELNKMNLKQRYEYKKRRREEALKE